MSEPKVITLNAVVLDTTQGKYFVYTTKSLDKFITQLNEVNFVELENLSDETGVNPKTKKQTFIPHGNKSEYDDTPKKIWIHNSQITRVTSDKSIQTSLGHLEHRITRRLSDEVTFTTNTPFVV